MVLKSEVKSNKIEVEASLLDENALGAAKLRVIAYFEEVHFLCNFLNNSYKCLKNTNFLERQ